MIALALSLVALFAFGYLIVGPANRSYSSRAWTFLVTFLAFMYLFVMIVSLIIGGAIDGSPVAPLDRELLALAYSVGAAVATGLGAGLCGYVDARRER